MVILHSIILIQDYPKHVFFKNVSLPNLFPFTFPETKKNQKHTSPRTRPQDLLITHYDCEENERKKLHNYAINYVTQCESEPQKKQQIEKRHFIQKLELQH